MMEEMQTANMPADDGTALGAGQPPEAPQPPARPTPAPPAPAKPERVRRVGTFTMGLALIFTGACIALYYLWPAFPVFTALKFTPVLLICLGVEVLVYAGRGARLKYDLLSMFVCFCMLVAGGCAALLPAAWQYWGPEREMARRQMANGLEQQASGLVDGKVVADVDAWVDLQRVDLAAGLQPSDPLYITVSLRGPYDGPEAFAADCKQVLGQLSGLPARLKRVEFSWEGGAERRYYLASNGQLDQSATAEQLAAMVTSLVQYEGDWYRPEELRDHLDEKDAYRREMLDSGEYTPEQYEQAQAEADLQRAALGL